MILKIFNDDNKVMILNLDKVRPIPIRSHAISRVIST